VPVPAGVEVKVDGQTVTVKGAKGEMSYDMPSCVSVKMEGNELVVSRRDEEKFSRSMHGTARSLIANMFEGVSKGYTRELEIQGVGYRAQTQGRQLVLNVGYSHPISFDAPEGITIEVKDNTKLSVSGADKQMVGQVSSRIRSFAPAEPYKGKGIRYLGEQVRRKSGKTVA
jgi:large subunit ribosomal protein L6